MNNKIKYSSIVDIFLVTIVAIVVFSIYYAISNSFYQLGLLGYPASDFISKLVFGHIFLFAFVPFALVGLSFLILIVRLPIFIIKHNLRKTIINACSILLCIMFVYYFCFLRNPGYIHVLKGFEEKVKVEANMVEIKEWLQKIGSNYVFKTPSDVVELSDIIWPNAIKKLSPKYVALETINNKISARLIWGGGFFGHWGLLIGPEEMKVDNAGINHSDSGFRLIVQEEFGKGVYIWYDSD